jgi:hypothetical protein
LVPFISVSVNNMIEFTLLVPRSLMIVVSFSVIQGQVYRRIHSENQFTRTDNRIGFGTLISSFSRQARWRTPTKDVLRPWHHVICEPWINSAQEITLYHEQRIISLRDLYTYRRPKPKSYVTPTAQGGVRVDLRIEEPLGTEFIGVGASARILCAHRLE